MREGYRVAAERSRRELLSAEVRAWAEATWLGLPSVAAALGSVLVGPTPGGLALAALALTGGAAACQKLALAHHDRRRLAALRAFLGGEALVSPGIWSSSDGRRRLRVLANGRCAWEHVDPVSGLTLASFIGPAPLAPEAPGPDTHVVRIGAAIHAPQRRACVFVGLPRPIGGSRPTRSMRVSRAVLEESARGVLLTRLDPRGRPAGDTFHPTRGAAIAQIEREHGPGSLGSWHTPGDAQSPRSSWELDGGCSTL